jgi:molecular chaperone IbpA
MTRELTLRSFDVPSLKQFGIGFDSFFDELSQATQQATNYPPYNIVKHSEDKYSIELAIAGFTDEDLTVVLEKNILTVTGDRASAHLNETEDAVTYIHRGISGRKFTRNFTLAEYVEVVGAHASNGILTINLEKIIPEEKKPRTIQITK